MQPPLDLLNGFAVACDVIAAGLGTPEAVQSRQRRRRDELLAHAARHSPLWRRRLGARGADTPWAEIEPVGKPALMAAFEDWSTDRALRLAPLRDFAADPARIGEACPGGHLLWTSSGSSGEPALFVQDAAALAVYDALEACRRPGATLAWADAWQPMAFVGATGGHFASTVSVERLRRLVPGLAARLHGFSFLQPLPVLCGQLESFAPSVLATYPTVALLLAQAQRDGRLRLALSELRTGGETLTPAMRRSIGEAFGCPVVDSYGASECLTMACECAHARLHLNADWVLLEPVDEAFRPVPDGDWGHTTLLSNLANRLQPILRYDLGDRVRVVPGRCACGSPLPVIEVEGRTDDLLTLQDAAGRAVGLPPLALVTVLEDEAGLFDFQLVQRGPRTLELRLHAEGAGAAAALARGRRVLRAHLRGQGLGDVVLQAALTSAGRAASGKLRRVVGLPRG